MAKTSGHRGNGTVGGGGRFNSAMARHLKMRRIIQGRQPLPVIPVKLSPGAAFMAACKQRKAEA